MSDGLFSADGKMYFSLSRLGSPTAVASVPVTFSALLKGRCPFPDRHKYSE